MVPSKTKTYATMLEVRSVDGAKLEKPIMMPYKIFPFGNVKRLEKGKDYTLRIYQTGGYEGIPAQAMKETTEVQTQGFGFATKIVVIRSL